MVQQAQGADDSRPDGVGDTLRADGDGALGPTLPRSGSGPSSHEIPGIAPGVVLGSHYRVEKLIGRGGVGAVYLAKHVHLGREFAVKVVGMTGADGTATDAVQRLIHEARTASGIEHENIVEVTHLGQTEGGVVFIVMELLRGEDLRTRLERQLQDAHDEKGTRWLPDEETRAIVRQILAGLSAAHRAQVIHRDLKPENVFLASRREHTVVKLVDFGMSKAQDEESLRLTKTGQIVGTPLYMSPEQSRAGAVDHRADIYAVGVMIYELLSGDVPFPADSIYECILKHATEAPPPLAAQRPDLPRAVTELVHRTLAKKVEDRPQSVDELAQAWEDAWSADAGAPGDAPSPQAAPVASDPDVAARGPTASVTAQAAAIAPAHRSSSPMGRVLPWVAIAAVIGLGFWGVRALSSDEDATPPDAPRGPEVATIEHAPDPQAGPVEPEVAPDEVPEPALPALAEHVVHVDSDPSGADVLIAGEVVGTTPRDVTIPEGEASIVITLHLRRHRELARTLTREDTTLRLPLERVEPRRQGPAVPDLAPR